MYIQQNIIKKYLLFARQNVMLIIDISYNGMTCVQLLHSCSYHINNKKNFKSI